MGQNVLHATEKVVHVAAEAAAVAGSVHKIIPKWLLIILCEYINPQLIKNAEYF